MVNYKINSRFSKNLGFEISHNEVFSAVNSVNSFLSSLPPNLYQSIDFKTTGAMIGAVYCTKLIDFLSGCVVNPIEKGHPDIIPISGLNSSEAVLRNYPIGLEIKGTIGNLRNGANLRAGNTRIKELSGITWQAHHREVNNLMGIVWDFVNHINNFNFPAITAVFFSDQLNENDWGQVSGLTGRNTKVSGMLASGKQKMGEGVVLLYDNEEHIAKYSSYLQIPRNIFNTHCTENQADLFDRLF